MPQKSTFGRFCFKAAGSSTDLRSQGRFGLLFVSLIAVSFDARTAGAQVCPDLVDIAPSGNANGELASGDCTLDEIGTSPDDQAVADLYRVTLTTSGFLSVGLESSAFDAVVELGG